MHYPCSQYIYFSTTYHISVYDITYKTLDHTHPVISNVADMGEYIPPNKGIYLERNLSLTISIINPEI